MQQNEQYDIDSVLMDAVAREASDVHIVPGSPPVLRVNGQLEPYGRLPLTPEDTESVLQQLASEAELDTMFETGESDGSYSLPQVGRFRVHAYRQRGSWGIAIRLVRGSIPTIEELGLPTFVQSVYQQQQGLFLVTGPTGSGKSTTLASLVDTINRTQRRHIVTLEDPIEYLHAHGQSVINQREVGSDTSSFVTGLRSALRQDPDVILIGEMRDLETMQIALSAAETGHLVLSTLHTMSAPQTIERIIDVFPASQQPQIRYQLATVLLGVVCQRLVPRTSGEGRLGVFEVLVNTPAVANLIRSGDKLNQLTTVMQTGRAHGMQTAEMHLTELLEQGHISAKTAGQIQSTFGGLSGTAVRGLQSGTRTQPQGIGSNDRLRR